MKNAIVVNEVSKEFRQYHPDRPRTLQESVLRGLRRVPVKRFWALHDVSFDIPVGRSFGVIGANGSGKSTLLRLLGRVMPPDRGSVKVHGRIGALLDLGAGFHHDLTGRENVFVNGIIGGLTRREVTERFDSIIAFAELEEFVDNPLRTYSTGMQMRLAFAIAVHVEPEVLLIDEVLSVGDLLFQRKCLERIAQFKAAGCTIVLVSHDITLIRDLCDEALWLRAGRLEAHDTAAVVVGRYVAAVEAETRRRTPTTWPVVRTPLGTELRVHKNRIGSLELEMTSVRLLDPHGVIATELDSGDPLRVEINYRAPQPIAAPVFNVTITREDDLVCYYTNTMAAGLTLPTIHGQGQVILHLERLDLNRGLYYLNVEVYERSGTYAYDCHWRVYPLLIRSTGSERGILYPPHRWQVNCEQDMRANLPEVKAGSEVG